MKRIKPVRVNTPCAKCGCSSRLWEVKGPMTWHTMCFACRSYREWTQRGGAKFSKLSKSDAERREEKFKKGLK